MATKATPAKKPDLHESVSNEMPDDGAGPKRATTQPGSEGVDPKTPQPAADGSEAVAGYKVRPEGMAAMAVKLPDTSKLRDIGEASFGAPTMAESIIGVDNRVQINPTTSFPWRANASLLITAADNSQWIGTGWFISPRTLITAGHVVFIKGSGVPGRDGWVRRIVVIPGRNGNAAPYGTVTSTSFRSVTGWTSSGNQEFDYGAIIIPTPLGNTTGWYGYGNYPNAQLVNQTINISGYPGDKPAGTQWYHSGKVTAVNTRKVYYSADTMGGQSGSAVYRIINGARMAVAVHAYGGATSNSGTRINAEVYNRMTSWKA
jgi:V8-like Glu-specific endopeptidase